MKFLLERSAEERRGLGLRDVVSTESVLGRAEQFSETYFEVPSTRYEYQLTIAAKASRLDYTASRRSSR